MPIDGAKLLTISRNLAEYGEALSTRTAPPDPGMYQAMGQAFQEVGAAITELLIAVSERPSA